MSNILADIGDTFLIKLDYPLTNIQQIFSYEEEITGAVGNLTREMRYTLDLLNWTEWLTLSTPNLQLIPINSSQDFNIEFRYTKTDSIGTIEVCWVKLNTQKGERGSLLQDTIFDVLDDSDLVSIKLWCKNVLEKVYYNGVVPKYITRGGGIVDRDYIDFWRGIICFYSILVIYSRRFKSLDKIDILRLYLDSLGIYYRSDSSLEELRSLVKRSSIVFQERGVLISEVEELFNSKDECSSIFILSEAIPGTVGFWLDHNSILERHVHDQIEVEILNVSHQNAFTNCSIDLEKREIVVGSTSIIDSGQLVVNPTIDYELVFLVKGSGSLTIDMKAFDNSQVEVNLLYLDQSVYPGPPIDGAQFPDDDIWRLVRLVVYGSRSETNPVPSILLGTNLQMSDNMCTLQALLSFTGTLVLKDLYLKILHTEYSKSFIQSSQLIDGWFKDSGVEKSPLDLAHQYLFNYSKTVLVNDLIDSKDLPVEQSCLLGMELPIIYIGDYRFILHKSYNNVGNVLTQETLQVGDVLDGSIPGGHLLGTYLGGDPADFSNPLVWSNWGGIIEE